MSSVFVNKVWRKVKLIPKGKVTTYKILARSLGRPKASRAVANALNKNPQLLQNPCHRVVKSNGEVGGYIKGEREKKRLLEKEGIKIRKLKVKSEKLKIKDLEKYLFKF